MRSLLLHLDNTLITVRGQQRPDTSRMKTLRTATR